MGEDPGDDHGRGDDRDHPHPPLALRTGERVDRGGPGRGPVGRVGPVDDLIQPRVIRQPLHRDGVAGAVAGQPEGEGAIVLGHPDAGVDMKARVGPLEHARGLVLREEAAAHEEPEYRPPERFRQPGGVMSRSPRPAHEGPVGPEPAIGDNQVEMGMPMGEGAVGLEAGDDPDRQIRLAGGGADRGGHGPRGYPSEIASQGSAVQTVGAEPFGDRQHHLPVGHRGQQRLVEPLAPLGDPLGVTVVTLE